MCVYVFKHACAYIKPVSVLYILWYYSFDLIYWEIKNDQRETGFVKCFITYSFALIINMLININRIFIH